MKCSVLKELIAHSSRKKAGAAQKAKALYESAKKSIGVKRIGSADRYRVKICLEEELLRIGVKSLQAVEKLLQKTV